MADAITFVIPGTPQPPTSDAGELNGTVKSTVRVGTRRAAGEAMRITAQPGDDVVVLRIANGPALYLHPEHAREMLSAQVSAAPAVRGSAAATSADGEVAVSAQLSWRGLESPAGTRGVLSGIGGALIDTFEVVSGLFKEPAVNMVTALATQKIDGQVKAGVYKLSPDELKPLKRFGQKLDEIPAAPEGEPILVLIHGTFVDTFSTFGKLWLLHRDRVRALFKHYDDRVYALDHPTVGASPLANALTLAEALPKNARLHLVTHSRGGIVAEVLARVAGGQGLRAEDLALFKGADYSQHLADLNALATLAKQRQFQVERMVRVACPARGTLLASRRLDAYLSVLKWSLELAGLRVLPEIVDFLSEVARRRTDPTELPGLEAMMPGRPVAEWLNAIADAVPGDLRVVSGDIEGDSITSWIKTLLSDAFYWTDNDLVVQTRSMYGGALRQDGAATFLLDRGGKVTHFNYFANERTAGAITNALVLDQPPEFRPIGPLSWKGEDASGTRAARAALRSRTGDPSARPAVLVLPGILGSHLKVDDKRVWLSLRFLNNLDQLRWDPATAERVTPDGPIGASYDDLIDYLADTHVVTSFSFDWRRPIEDEANRLADEIEHALAERAASNQPVRIVAHSMGGLVVRTMQLERPDTWSRMLQREGARVLMLGTPNGGSWAPMQVLSGDDTFGNMLSAFGSLFDAYRARRTIASMTGLIQLQAGLLDASLGLGDAGGWRRLEEADLKPIRERMSEQSWWHKDNLQLDHYRWGLPPPDVLRQAVALRERLDAQREIFGADATKVLLVVGKAPLTPNGIETTDAGIKYLNLREDGDGRVTLADARLPGVRTWRVDAAHGDLADARHAFAAYEELLAHGDTRKLDLVPEPRAAARGTGAGAPARSTLVATRPSRSRQDAEPPATQREVFAATAVRGAAAAPPVAPVRITVMNGNLKFIQEPLMLGHYRSLKLTGTEAVMDVLIGGTMSRSLRAGLYPSAIDSHQVFLNTRRDPENPFVMPRPEAVVVVGLGEEGNLRAADLITTVRQAALACAQRMSEKPAGGPATFDLAATLIGTGGIGVGVGSAAQAIAQGVAQANERLVSSESPGRWPVIGNLRLIELYLDRATEAHHALAALATTASNRFDLVKEITTGRGALPRPVKSGYRGAGYDFIRVEQRGDRRDAGIEFTLDTQRARTEVHGRAMQSKLIDELVQVGANDQNHDPQIGKTLFQLLVPMELRPFLSDSSSILLQLDAATAIYPWELLDTQPDDSASERPKKLPWSVRTSMLRKLRTREFRRNPVDASSDAGVLVVGEPLVDLKKYAELPGAAEEAQAVADIFGVPARLKLDALKVVNAALEQPYKVIHIAGHGIYFKDGGGGVVLSNDTVFGPREISAMPTVPELAFINCCHLGRIEGDTGMRASGLGNQKPQFAANVAEELIRNGVRCVVAAGWAVGDQPAKLFATRFYQSLTNGRTFVQAVGAARKETQESFPNSNTWAAYQCYGDPDWRYRRDRNADEQAAPRSEGIVSADDLELELKTLAIQAKYDSDKEGLSDQLARLDAGCGGRWGRYGRIAESFGDAYGEAGNYDNAIRWYLQAVAAEDGSASFRASEQLGNLRARRGAKMSNLQQGRREIQEATRLLKQVFKMRPTSERANLVASAFKRLAMVEAKDKREDAFRKAVDEMTRHYRDAEKLALESNAGNPYYPSVNRITAALVLNPGQGNVLDPNDIGTARQWLKATVAQNPDFWSVVGLIELDIYQALQDQRLDEKLDKIRDALADLKDRVRAPRMWSSVRDQAEFILSRYIDVSEDDPAERDAAKKLLAILQSYADGG